MLINKLKRILSGQFIRNVGWLGAAELANRVFRLGTTVTLARMFSPQDYGLVAIIYTVLDFANVFTFRGGLAAKIIQVDEKDLKTICDTSYWLNWILCVSIFIFQCIAAFPLAHFYDNQLIILPLCTSALVYLMMPLYMVHSAIIERENRLKITALCNATQSLLSNIITIILALLGMGVWAVVWAMVLTTPVWIVINQMNQSWRAPKSFTLENFREIISFGGNVVGVGLLNRLRSNIDYLIIGSFLGIDALGVYYFAFNAGLGISLNVINVFSSALFPYLCEVRDDIHKIRQRFFSSLQKTFVIVVPLILTQTLLAPFYVPIIFGQKWVSAIPILMIICLSALPLPFYFAVYYLLNAIDKTRISLYISFISTTIFTIFVLVAVKWGILWVAISVLMHRIMESIIQFLILNYYSSKILYNNNKKMNSN
ncbi:lipopolysaccharide biosynthesis protein [Nostocales cyanobacterium LEGE 12452]|nr:lipopolysaccharide biosynthesis protein [Nostocales cyanobacterium LEGE 12452]